MVSARRVQTGGIFHRMASQRCECRAASRGRYEAHGCLRMLKPNAPGVDGAATRSVDSAEPIYVFRKPVAAAPPAVVGGADKSTRALGALLAGW